ncbi:MAG TPA: hypothetical protein PLI95_08595 [Polyangiaceae bacterium]|nr:hypothetical protein [Polyangiaceae bacterium]
MPLQNIVCTFLAPIPVGHRVALEYHEREVGLMGRTKEIDGQWFVVIDLDTGIRWGSQYSWSRDPPFVEDPDRKPKERYEGVVRACDVSSFMGVENLATWTRLVVDVVRRTEL